MPTSEGKWSDRLEPSILDIFEKLFVFDDDEARRLRSELRRRSGTQYGTDITFWATAVTDSHCLVVCKNYQVLLKVADIADKVLQAEADFEYARIDHCIFISPRMDPNNELNMMIEQWNAAQKFPFTIQLWSPQSDVQGLFAIVPDVYRAVYGQDPPEATTNPSTVVSAFAHRLQPVIRRPERPVIRPPERPVIRPPDRSRGHVFISYVSEDSKTVDRLQRDLQNAGVKVWRDRSDLGPGARWKDSIRHAIAEGTYFLCCFSEASTRRTRSYMNEELMLAVEELRVRSRTQTWFLPVIFPGGVVPDWPVGAGETLRDFNFTILSPDTWSDGVANLVRTIQSVDRPAPEE